jgi:hypothetical protein
MGKEYLVVHRIDRMYSKNVACKMSTGRWYYAVAMPYSSGQLRAAWEVLMGRAFAIKWPEPGDIEKALGKETP